MFEPVTKPYENTSQNETKTFMETSDFNIKALENLNNKFLEIMNHRVKLASYLMSHLSIITNLDNSSQFKLVKDSNSNRVIDLLIKTTLPNILHDNLLTFRSTGKVFELKGDRLNMITNKNYNVDLASLADKKLLHDSAKKMHYDVRGIGNESTRDRTLIKVLKAPAIMDSGISKIIFLSSDSDELCIRLKLVLQEKHAGNNLKVIDKEVFTILEKLLENKCSSKKQHKHFLIKCNLLQE